MNPFTHLDDQALLFSTRRLVARSNELDAEFLLHLGEIDARGFYRDLGFSSLFAFCVGELGFSEDAAFRRVDAARLLRRFECLEQPLREGRVHLTCLNLLSSRLTEENVEELLSACAGKKKEQVKEVLAARFPQASVPDSIRKLPTPVAPLPSAPSQVATLFSAPVVPQVPVTSPPPAPARRPKVEPLAPDAYLVQFTANKKLRDLLAQAKELFSHELPSGDLATLVEKAFELLVAEKMKSRFGVGAKPRAMPKPPPGKRPSRHVPMAKRRELACRGKLQCEFAGPDGRRCEETAGLEIDHVEGFAVTGEHSSLRLLCRAHNQLEAERLFGRDFMARKRREARPARAATTRASASSSEEVTRASAGRAPLSEEVTRASAGKTSPTGEVTRASAGSASPDEKVTRASAGSVWEAGEATFSRDPSEEAEPGDWPLRTGEHDQLSLL